MPSSVTESLRNSSDMHQSADRPTSVYITRLTVAVWPPNTGNANNVRNVNTDGSLNNNNANNTNGVRPVL